MFSISDSWLGLGIVLMIGVFVVGLATCIGKSIIWIFGTGHDATVTSGKKRATVSSAIHGPAATSGSGGNTDPMSSSD